MNREHQNKRYPLDILHHIYPISSANNLMYQITTKSALFTGAPSRPPRLRPTPPSSPPRRLLPPPLPHSVNREVSVLSLRFEQAREFKVLCSETEVEDELNEEACELVNGAELIIGQGDDAVNAYLFKAVKNNNGTGIILLSDIFGFEDSFTRDFAYRVACNGFNVLVPDLFRGDPWAREKPRELFREWLDLQDPDRVAKHIDISTKWMAEELVAAGISKKLGLIGFCYGGSRVVETLARDETSSFATGVSFYGTRMDTSIAANVKVPILFVAGDEDPLCPSDIVKKFEEVISRGSKAVIFKGRGHGFAHRPETPEDDANAEQAFAMMRNWLSEKLAVGEELTVS